MDFSSGGEGSAVLQLQKLRPSDVQLNLSQFREAFISPTRELLLLLSYQCEAMLLPLVKGEAIDNMDSESSFLNIQNPSSVAPSLSDPKEKISSTYESIKMVSDDDLSPAISYSRSDNNPFVCDVNSLAWGICEDTYNQNETALFRELLFVSGNHGVTVHAFCQPWKISEMTRPTMEGEHGQGVWVDWGPTSPLPYNMTALERSSLHCETSGEVVEASRTNRTTHNVENLSVKAGENEISSSVAQKRWLRTFLTKTEMLKSENNNTFTRFPERSSLPSSATVVSFNIFDTDSQFSNFQSVSRTISLERDNCNDSVFDLVTNTTTNLDSSSSSIVETPDVLSKFLTGSVSSSYKCSRVFSSDSHHLIGFAFTLVDPIPVSTSDISESDKSRIVLLVAKIISWGIQWVCLVKLAENLDRGPVVEWTDFKFYDNFLICLTACGLIYFYVATTGEYVMHLDLLQIHALDPQLKSLEREKFGKGDEAPTTAEIEGKRASTSSYCDFAGKRMFGRLLVASNTSLLAVTDTHGVVYVICVDDHMRAKNHTFEKSLRHIHHICLGSVVGWEVGGAEIGCQRKFSDISQNMLSIKDKHFFMDDMGSDELRKVQDCWERKVGYKSFVSGFSAGSHIMEDKFPSSELSFHAIRKIFLPTQRFEEDNMFYFSTFGLTRFIKQKNKERTSQIVHSNLHVDSAINDDKYLNRQGWEAYVGEVVGCTFQGCFYLVSEGGLSVVLPSVSLSSNFFPFEAIAHRQTIIGTTVASQAGDLIESKEIKLQPCLPWKIEVLDRILLYEAPEEADHLCLENGWDLKISRIRRLQLALDYLTFEEIEMFAKTLELIVLFDG